MSSIAKVLLKLNINMETRFPLVLTRWRRHFLSLFLAISVTVRLQSQKLIFRIMLRRCMYLKTNMFKKIGNWVVRPLMWSLLYYSSVGQIDKILLNITRSQHFLNLRHLIIYQPNLCNNLKICTAERISTINIVKGSKTHYLLILTIFLSRRYFTQKCIFSWHWFFFLFKISA